MNVDRMISTFRQAWSDLGQSGIKSCAGTRQSLRPLETCALRDFRITRQPVGSGGV